MAIIKGRWLTHDHCEIERVYAEAGGLARVGGGEAACDWRWVRYYVQVLQPPRVAAGELARRLAAALDTPACEVLRTTDPAMVAVEIRGAA